MHAEDADKEQTKQGLRQQGDDVQKDPITQGARLGNPENGQGKDAEVFKNADPARNRRQGQADLKNNEDQDWGGQRQINLERPQGEMVREDRRTPNNQRPEGCFAEVSTPLENL